MAYQAAMKAEQERLAKAQKRNFEMASGSVGGSDDERDTKEEAWASVFASTSAAGAESAEEQRRRKLQRKTERRKEKAAAAEANMANFTAYVTGIRRRRSSGQRCRRSSRRRARCAGSSCTRMRPVSLRAMAW